MSVGGREWEVIGPEYSLKEYARDLWRYRELAWSLALRDILIKFKGTYLGLIWVLLRPMLLTYVFVLVFQRVLNVKSQDAYFFAFVFSGICPWIYFSSVIGDSASKLFDNSELIKKVYFPRILLPVAVLVAQIPDLLLATFFLIFYTTFFTPIEISFHFFILPFALLYFVFISMGIVFWVSYLGFRFKDFRHLVPFALQLGFFISPIAFGLDDIPESLRVFYALNPLVSGLSLFRSSLLSQPLILTHFEVISMVSGLVVTVTGFWIFWRGETKLVDEV